MTITTTTTTHPAAEVLEQVYVTFTTGDMDRLAELIAADVVWHVPGDSLISGTYTSREAMFVCFNADHRVRPRRHPSGSSVIAASPSTAAISRPGLRVVRFWK